MLPFANKGLTSHRRPLICLTERWRSTDSINVISGKDTDFPIWLFLSVAIHLIPAIVIALIPRPLTEISVPVYQVELMTRPEAEEAPKMKNLHEEPKVEPEVKVKI